MNTRFLVFSGATLAAGLATLSSVGAQALVPRTVLWQNDFEANTVGDATGASPSVINGFRFNFPGGIVRDSETVAPFGAPNQYLELTPDNNPNANDFRVIVNAVMQADYTAAPVGFSYDFNESTGPGFPTSHGFGTGAADFNPDVNTGQGILALNFRNGATTLGPNTTLVSVGDPEVDPQDLPSYTEGEVYRFTFITNFTGGEQTILGPDGAEFQLDPMQAAFWMFDYDAEEYGPRVVIENNNDRALDTHVSFILRHFTAAEPSQRQTIYVDSFEASAYGEPASIWSGQGTDELWSNSENWQNAAVPEEGATVIFAGNDNIDPDNDLPADTRLSEIIFENTTSTFFLLGNRVEITNRIENNSDQNQLLKMPLLLEEPLIDIGAGPLGTLLTLDGMVSGAGGFRKTGTGELELTAANDFTGDKIVDQGSVFVDGNQSAATGSWHVRGGGASGTPVGGVASSLILGSTASLAVSDGGFIQVGHNAAAGGFAAQVLDTIGEVENEGTLFVGRSGTISLDDGSWTQVGAATVATQGGGLATLNIRGGTFDYQSVTPFHLATSTSNNAVTSLNIDGGVFATATAIHNPTTTLSPEDSAFARVLIANGGTLRLTADIVDLFTTAGANRLFVTGFGGGAVDTNGFDATLHVPIGGDGAFTKQGDGTLTTTASHTYAGDTIVAGGVMVLSTPTLDPDFGVVVESGAVLSLDFSGTNAVASLELGGTLLSEGTYDASTHPTFLSGTGSLTVGSLPEPGDTFASWAAALGLSGDPSADFDGDGIPDLLEFIFGTDPTVPGSGSPVVTSNTDDNLILVFTRDERSLTPDVSLAVEAGADLATWPLVFEIGPTTGESSPGVEVTANGDGTDTITVTIPKNEAPLLFARVRADVDSPQE